ncbi:MAG TPA: hypothetical protein VM578_11190 [Candidatus Saccharimonadales bacterium]|nr:hypothetical protein [Candidatus Saccharimonadales bacterium]
MTTPSFLSMGHPSVLLSERRSKGKGKGKGKDKDKSKGKGKGKGKNRINNPMLAAQKARGGTWGT